MAKPYPNMPMDQPYPTMPIPSRTPGLPPPPQPSRLEPKYFKTQHCDKFRNGFCPYEENCSYAHGDADLRPWQGPVDPQRVPVGFNSGGTRETKVKVCFEFQKGKMCKYGEKCNYLHQRPENWVQIQRLEEFRSAALMPTVMPVAPPPLPSFSQELNKTGVTIGGSGIDQDHDCNSDVDMIESGPRWKRDPKPTSYFGLTDPHKIERIYGDWLF